MRKTSIMCIKEDSGSIIGVFWRLGHVSLCMWHRFSVGQHTFALDFRSLQLSTF